MLNESSRLVAPISLVRDPSWSKPSRQIDSQTWSWEIHRLPPADYDTKLCAASCDNHSQCTPLPLAKMCEIDLVESTVPNGADVDT